MAKRRCRWCGELGHNVRTCPKRKERVEELENSENPADRQLAERHKARFSSNRVRRCSHCHSTEHTIRKCPDYAELINDRSGQVHTIRKAVAEAMQHFDFGVGSIVESNRSDWCSKSRGYEWQQSVNLVREVRWDTVGEGAACGGPIQWSRARIFVSDIATGKEHAAQFPWEILQYVHSLLMVDNAFLVGRSKPSPTRSHAQVKLVSPGGCSIPEEFLDEEHTKKWTRDFMKKR